MSSTPIGYEISAGAIIAEAKRQEAERERAAIHAAGPQTCGRFSFDPATGAITGPAGYMQSESYTRRMAAITEGRDTVTSFGYSQHGDLIKAVLVSLQTDYASWKGMRDFMKDFDGRGALDARPASVTKPASEDKTHA
ncbi:MAG: hypothetical protein IT577_19095 [Verrucomicrobiae bacterium]|nr:hypothetical protein [Verrucomicrobiae bacterium]